MQTPQKYREEILKEPINHQRDNDFNLKKEFDEWDSLSDEALLNFEDTL